MSRVLPPISVDTCGKPGTPYPAACATYLDAYHSAASARHVGDAALIISSTLAISSFTALVWSDMARAPIQVAAQRGRGRGPRCILTK